MGCNRGLIGLSIALSMDLDHCSKLILQGKKKYFVPP
jgi:hypothetical protein